jgi:hypothetical protein
VIAVSQATEQAREILRNPDGFQWATVTLLAFVMYVYSVEIERRHWDIVLAGLAFWLMDGFNEIVNSVILHASDRAALWTVTGHTSYLILIGLTIEISFMFLVAGVIFVKQLPTDPKLKILGVNNRVALAFGFSVFCVFVEVLLRQMGVFHWDYWWWNFPCVPLIIVFGYMTFFLIAAWVYDMPDNRRRLRVVGTLAAIDALGVLAFGLIGWL